MSVVKGHGVSGHARVHGPTADLCRLGLHQRARHVLALGEAVVHRWRRSFAIVGLVLALALGLFGRPVPVWAEGSRSLYPAGYPVGGSRANLDYSATGSLYLNKVRRRGFLYVYAQQNEYIVLGSRNRSNAGDISVYNPQYFGTPGDETVPGTADFTCSGGSAAPGPHYFGGTRGTITTRAQELAGPNSADNTVPVTNGFQPCAYRAPATGIYGVVFGTANTGGDPDGSIATPALSSTTVSAWDVTVRANATSVTDINGRLFTYAFVGYTAANSRPVYSTHYYVTSDGYRYSQDVRGLDPNGYALYANPVGFLDNLQPLYKDIRGNDALVTTNVPLGVTTQVAQFPMFFSDISPGGANATEVDRVLIALGIPLTPPSPTLTNVYFTGHVGGSTTTTGAGGTFHFRTTDTITYMIIVSRNGSDFSPENTANALLTGIAGTGTHTAIWDGKDQTGANFPSSATPYPFRVWGRNGEVHFPIVDAENNPNGGPTITRLNGTSPGDRTVFFDDRGYRTSGGTLAGVLNGTLCPGSPPAACLPPVSLLGVDSSTSYRAWQTGGNSNTDCNATAGWGDAKAVNLWTYFSTPNLNNTLVVTSTVVDVATSVTAPSSAIAGSIVPGSFSFTNNGSSNALGVTYGMTLTPGLGAVTFGNLPGGVTASYNNATGTVTLTGMPTTLTPGQTLSAMSFSYTAPATGPVTATTTIGSTSPEETYLANNTATASTGIGAFDLSTTVSVPGLAAGGSIVSGSFDFANYGTNAATAVTYSATIGSPGNYPASVTFTDVPPGATASYNPVNGQVTFTGLPTILASGRSLGFAFDYTAPASGTVPVNTAIAPASGDAVQANNTASGTTTISAAPDLTIAKSHTGNFTQGQVGAQYTVTVTNVGPGPTSASVTVTDTIPAGLTATAIGGTGWTCNVGTLSCTRLDALGAGSSYPAITLTVNVASNASSPLTNAVSVSVAGDTNPDNNSTSDPTTINALGSVSGVVFNDPNGNGTQDAGELGIGGVTVQLKTGAVVVASTTTAGDGSYTFTSVAPGSYTVVETDPSGYVSTTSNAVPVSVAPGGAATATFGDQQVGTVSGVVFNDPNGNGTQDGGESGIGGVTVQLRSGSTVVATTTTVGDGSYTFTSVAPGSYTVVETDPSGYVSTTNNTVPVSVAAGGAATATFGDQQVGTVSGVVFNDPNGSGTQDAGELGIGGVTVQLKSGAVVVASTTTAGDGSYTFTSVTPGSYTVVETDPSGYVSTTSNAVPVSVAAGGAATANFGDQQVGTVSGVVFNDPNGNGVQDAGELGIGGVTVQLKTGAVVVATTTTAGDGSYSFTSVTPGSYTVQETDPSGYVSTMSNTVAVSVAPGGAATATFGDQQVGTVSGTVFNDPNGNGTQDPGELGIGGVTVQLKSGSTVVASTTTAGDGSYTFTSVTPGSYTVQETDPSGYVSTTNNTVPVSVAAGGAATATFGDQQVGTVSGVVFNDPNGNGTQDPGELGIGGVTVQLKSGSTVVASTTTAGDGSYSFTSVTPGSYTVQETDPSGYVSTTSNTVPVSVAAGGAATANFGDQQVGTVSGVVFNDPNGSGTQDVGELGIGGVTVQLRSGSTVVATTTTAGDGSYTFTSVTPGSYAVQETDPSGYVSTTINGVPVSVAAGGAATANFGDQQVGTVSGVVFNDPNGNGTQDGGELGIGGVTVQLKTGAVVVASTTTAGDGSYTFTSVAPGSYTVVETDPSGYVSTTSNAVPVSVAPGGAATATFGDQQVGTVSGVVFNDPNGNGTQDGGESGIGGVTVQLRSGSTVVATTTTVGDGSYTFTSVAPGSYTVRGDRPIRIRLDDEQHRTGERGGWWSGDGDLR